MQAPLPDNEAARLEALREYQILDTAPEQAFDDLTLLATQICGTPIALVSLLDADRQWFKSKVGLDVTQTSRDVAFCAHAISQPDVLIVPNALADPRFATNPLVTSDPQIRFYAGAPLITSAGHTMGTLCVIDRVPRELSPQQVEALQALSRQATRQIELRQQLVNLSQVNQALQESEERFRLLVQGVRDYAIFMLAPDGIVVSWNAGAERIKGYRTEEIVGQHFSRFYPREDIERGKPELALEVATAVGQFEDEGWRIRKNGSRFWAHVLITALRDESGNLRGFAKVTRDITERKRTELTLQEAHEQLETRVSQRTVELAQANAQLRAEIASRQQAEQELRASEERFRATFNQAAVGIAHVGIDGKWLLVNQKLCEIVGYSLQELQSLTFQEITHPHDLDIDVENVRHLLANEIQTYSMEKRYIRKDATHVWINLTVSLLRGSQGEPNYLISVVEDISERKQAEEALRQLNATLEQRVAERTAQLEETNQELEAFTYSVSHDLRAPLRTIQGFANALLEDCGEQLEDFCRSYIDSIVDDAVQMNELISDLLDYSRLTRTQIRLQPTALDDVVNETLKQLTAQIGETQAQIRVASPLPQVIAHRPTLIQVVTNLISNAIKFTELDTQPQIDIFTTTEEEDRQEWIRLWIVDNGIGIAPEHQERIFRVFERLHGAERYPGTGIGLAIVRKGLDRMGGQVGVESQLGQGSRFWVALPRAVLTSDLAYDTTTPPSSDC